MKFSILLIFIFVGFCQSDNTSTSIELPDYLVNVSISSIEEVLSSNIDRNGEIIKKIIDLTSQLLLDERSSSPIKWHTTDGLVMKKSISVNVDRLKVLFHDFYVQYSGENQYESFSTTITCNTPKNVTFDVELPSKITVRAGVLILQPYVSDIEGSISIIMENSKIIKYFEMEMNDSNSNKAHSANIYYEKSEIHLQIEKEYQKIIYAESETFLNEAELLLSKFFSKQLDKEFSARKDILQSTCSKGIRPIEEQNKNVSGILNIWYFKEHLYFIPSSVSTWNEVELTIGPIIIDGLSYFNNIGPKLWENAKPYHHQPYYHDGYRVDHYVRLRSGPLRGKLELKFKVQKDNKQDISTTDEQDTSTTEQDKSMTNVYTFLIDYIQLETEFQPRDRRSYDHPHNYNVKINLNFGATQTKPLETNGTCIRRNQFMDNVVSENLKEIVKNSLLNSMKETWQPIITPDGWTLGFHLH